MLPIPVIVSFIIGASLFGLLYLINLKFKFDYVFGVYGLAIFVLGFFIMLYIPDPNNSFASFGYLIMLILSVFALLGYVTTWVLVKRVFKK
jgi:glucose uptake protein GlcU